MPNLFDVITINKMKLRNRFLRSATMDYLADGGMVTDSLLAHYSDLAAVFMDYHRKPLEARDGFIRVCP